MLSTGTSHTQKPLILASPKEIICRDFNEGIAKEIAATRMNPSLSFRRVLLRLTLTVAHSVVPEAVTKERMKTLKKKHLQSARLVITHNSN